PSTHSIHQPTLSTTITTLFPYTTLFRSSSVIETINHPKITNGKANPYDLFNIVLPRSSSLSFPNWKVKLNITAAKKSNIYAIFPDRKSTRLNSSHVSISYAVFCLKKKKH